MVGGCEYGGVVVEWLVACCEMGVWLWVWLFVGILQLWDVVCGVSSFCFCFCFVCVCIYIYLLFYLMGRNCLYYFNELYFKIGDEI